MIYKQQIGGIMEELSTHTTEYISAKQLGMSHDELAARLNHAVYVEYCKILKENQVKLWDELDKDDREGSVETMKLFSGCHWSAAEMHDKWLANKLSWGWRHGTSFDVDKMTSKYIYPYSHLTAEKKLKAELHSSILDSVRRFQKGQEE